MRQSASSLLCKRAGSRSIYLEARDINTNVQEVTSYLKSRHLQMEDCVGKYLLQYRFFPSFQRGWRSVSLAFPSFFWSGFSCLS